MLHFLRTMVISTAFVTMFDPLANASISEPVLNNIRLGEPLSDLMQLMPKLHSIEHVACVSDYIGKHQRVVRLDDRNGHCVKRASWHVSSMTISVTLQEDIPRRPGISVVSDIDQNWVTSSARDQAMFLEMALSHLGKPGITDGRKPWVVALWCFGFRCKAFDPLPTFGPVLTIDKGYGADLFDNAAAATRISAADTILAAHHITLQP